MLQWSHYLAADPILPQHLPKYKDICRHISSNTALNVSYIAAAGRFRFRWVLEQMVEASASSSHWLDVY